MARHLSMLVLMLLVRIVDAATLEVALDGLDGRNGKVRVAVIADEAGWNHSREPAAVQLLEPGEMPAPLRVRFDDLAPGRYAVEAYHDVNANGRLDANLLRIPKEPVGASRNPDVWRRPRFDECVFELPESGAAIEIHLK
jgi:uncharacterized protein (DUF2141 family)